MGKDIAEVESKLPAVRHFHARSCQPCANWLLQPPAGHFQWGSRRPTRMTVSDVFPQIKIERVL